MVDLLDVNMDTSGVFKYTVKLTNATRGDFAIELNEDKEIMELPFPVSNNQLDLAKKSNTPIMFVIFSNKNGVIDEFSQLWKQSYELLTELHMLRPGEAIVRNYGTTAYGNTTAGIIKDGKRLYVEFYVVYTIGTTTYWAKSNLTKVKVKCNKRSSSSRSKL